MTSPAKQPTTIQALRRLDPFVRPVRRSIVIAMAMALAASLVSLAVPQVLQRIVDGPLASKDPAQIPPAVALIALLGVLEAALYFARRLYIVGPATGVEANLRRALFAKLQDLPVAFHDRWPSGQLLSRSMSDLSLIRRFIAFGFIYLVVNVITIAVGVVVLAFLNPLLAVVFTLCSVPLWINGFRFERRYHVVARRSQDQQGDLATLVEESVHGIRVLKAFGRGRTKLKGFLQRAEELRGTEIEKARAVAQIWLWLLLVPDVAFALCLLVGVWQASLGNLTVGGLVAFFATATVLRFPLESIGFLLSMMYDTRTATDRLFEVFDEENTIRDPEHPKHIAEARGRLEFQDVHFHYPDAPEGAPDLLDGMDLTIEPGETMALVGLTGSGKTTAVEVAGRLYDVTGGRVLLDGVDIRDLTRVELRTHIAMAFEEATLFSASVRDNVLLGRPDAGERVLQEALDIAQASFVHDLPEGLDTVIGEEGLSLSGGQRQRLALARAVAANPAVLVLDDPLSALDVDTEALVEAALRQVLTRTTALIVAHRPSTVQLADRVALLEGGRIIAVGTHTELLATSERYRFVISSLEDEQTYEEVDA
ncbi:ABC transporter ATP-binding protein [Amnibacterium kyonggiense]|uniref:ATP-binding cassette subfamily B protein n=1 Tax=Amnibacterium kyonggiense TaxID=595671 RepID=A0A4R7FQY5_9MICO|nr:ABC transporter ATP-binding protein [Amnibacterium kyonggiense]TDS80207.1 ATP-binding cassette subfamily B protein [Amnibacterium kyonggiense]